MKHVNSSIDKSKFRNRKSISESHTLKKKNEEISELHKALAYAESIVTALPTPLLLLYPAFKIRTANKAFYKTFKVSPKETEGKLIYKLGNGQWDIPLLRKLLEEILPQKKILNDFEVDHSFTDIGHKIMLLSARSMAVQDEDDPMILLAIEDITEERSIESAVEKERKLILENIPSGLITLDRKWQFTYCNKKAESIIEKKLAEIEGKNVWKILPEGIGSPLEKYCRKAIKTDRTAAFEEFFPKLKAWYNIRVFSLDEGLSIYFDDITKQKEGEAIIEHERKKIFNLFMHAPALICVLHGPKQVYELANKPYMQMVGLNRELIGIPIRQAIPELKDQGIFEILDKVYKSGNSFIGKEMHIRLKNPETGKIEDTVLNFVFQPYKNNNGKTEGIISYASDITSLVNKRIQIEKLLRQKDEFIGVASHELKTPVTSIKGYTQILQARFANEGNTQAVDLLTRMDGQINKLTKLITDLLDATKIEGGKLQYYEAYFDLNELVNETVEEMQQTSQRHTIIAKLAATAKIYGDRDRIGQVMTNFISNAIKYSPDNNKVILTYTKTKSKISVCVKDYGIGLSKQNQNKVFDRFYRVSGIKEDTFPGMGLGLFISSEIIKRHKGEISVKSILRKGSTFCFTLPI